MATRTRVHFTNAKTYAMYRMTLALGRAIAAGTNSDKDRASRWAAAWGLVAGIFGKGIRLKSKDIFRQGGPGDRRRKPR